ncbi:splicing factor Cactin [Pongo pygmaeus]|uniref:Splicing factor Cactin n=2 Tax=Pongo abelii TaxID=9601 RepID=A0A2J8SBH9_PONAB|nr:splicing factor Cactin [Pongo pygmaeus]PNJ18126.1 CACTIN isoform 1 [Pongo abelii]PNJ18129.1 CACTIN isoform 4 [Pongo abelii]PNJ18130.1 CACTIN isoform 5 [Pongo abelii]PNJ18131.1 CACTIN isoform 6 [Pongo abelii]
MGRDTRSRSRSASRRGRRQRSQSRSRSRSRSHGRRNRRRREDEGRRRRRRRSRERRSDSEEERWQRSGMRSRSPPRPRWHSRDGSSQSDSGEEQSRGQWARRRRRTRSWSPSSSASSSTSPGRSQSPRAAAAALSQQQSLQERLRLREERKQQEELMKAFETPEEKRARRLAKKEAKERKKREKMGWGEEYMGYTNTDNPFGDNNLLGTFIWNKALEKKGISHLEEKELKERNKRIQEDNRLELQKVKQLRLEREREKAMREQELEMLQREKEAEHFKTWEEQEDNFHLQQAKLRSKIRIRDGRAKPIDLLAKYISAEDDDLAVEMHEPYTFLNGLTVADMEDLLEDIQVYMELEQGKNADFWRDMTTITEDEISKLRKLEASGKGPGERREGVNASVSSDVQSVFKGKTYNQLQVIFQGIEGKIRAGGPNLDMGYWESLLQQLRAHMARARLRERHQDVLRQKLYKLKQEQGVESEPLFPILKQESQSPSRSLEPEDAAPTPPGPSSEGGPAEAEVDGATPTEGDGDGDGDGDGEGEGEAVLMEEDLIQQSLDDYDAGRYSPRLLTAHELPLDAHVLEPDEDLQRLQLSRQQLQVTGDASESAEDIFFRRAKEGMGQDEAQFSVEMPLTGKAYLWADKYRPRKPRFFNRVHTGFEWNKYNQTHYDFDNPPPKIVQGYKFNIFYPDLIDKRSTPEYFLEACADNKDFAILRFHAGPPYEDIAFKIVNREWEYSHRHGFRCQFANGIFQLWFHFKRYRYRR